MTASNLTLLLYFLPIFVIWYLIVRRRKRLQEESAAVLRAQDSGESIGPVSLHPLIDPNRCIGCRACLAACPEQPTHKILGLIRGKAELINPSDCIGHGACKAACPVDAITLVFGSERRGVDIPQVGPDFQTNVPGIFIAGELGGMGLIRNALEQGRQAIDSVARYVGTRRGESDVLDVVIVGAGPAGLAASLAAQEKRLRYVTVEQDSIGGTTAHYPRRKLVMTAAADLPLVGKFRFAETTKEKLIEFWKEVERKTGIKITYHERVEDIAPEGRDYSVRTNRNAYRARAILLAIGRRGTPRKLEVPGEEMDKVVYRLIDAAQYRGRHVLVVGGGDSALEAALAVSAEPGTTVTLSYRSDSFSRAKAKNRQAVQQAAGTGRLTVLFGSRVIGIAPDNVALDHAGKLLRIANDAVIVCAGGVLPTPMLKQLGIEIETKYGTA